MSNAKADSALAAIPTPGEGERALWFKVGTAYKAAGGDFSTWDAWSRRGGGYDAQSARDTWNSIDPNGGVTERTLYRLANDNGWKDPEHGQGQMRPSDPDLTLTAQPPQRAAQPPRAVDNISMTPKARRLNAGDFAAVMAAAREDAKTDNGAYQYFRGRGLTDATIARFNLGGVIEHFDLAKTNERRAIIPYPGEDYYTARRLSQAGDSDGKYLYPPKSGAGKKRAFNLPALTGGAKVVYVVEGQIDTMTIEQAAPAGVAAIGCNEARQMLEAIARTAGELTAETYIIIPDADKAGEGKAAKMRDALARNGHRAYIRPLPEGRHDCNDFLVAAAAEFSRWMTDTGAFLEDARREERDALKAKFGAMTCKARMPQFEEDVANARPPIPTGFLYLDRGLDGGLYPEVTYIGAEPNVGKTTFTLQIADNAAKEGRKVIIVSMEMSAGELMAKSISRITYELAEKYHCNDDCRKSARDILLGKRYAKYSPQALHIIGKAKAEYLEYADNITVIEGDENTNIDAIAQLCAEYIDANEGETPLLIVDYLQLVPPKSIEASDKQNVDMTVRGFKTLSRRFKMPIVVISSFNRNSYGKRMTLAAFKESGGIEYGADKVIGLQYEGGTQAEMEKSRKTVPQPINAFILKGRLACGHGGYQFALYPKCGHYKELSPIAEEDFTAVKVSYDAWCKEQDNANGNGNGNG